MDRSSLYIEPWNENMGTLNPMKVPMFSGYVVVEVVLSWLLLLLSQADSSASKLGRKHEY